MLKVAFRNIRKKRTQPNSLQTQTTSQNLFHCQAQHLHRLNQKFMQSLYLFLCLIPTSFLLFLLLLLFPCCSISFTLSIYRETKWWTSNSFKEPNNFEWHAKSSRKSGNIYFTDKFNRLKISGSCHQTISIFSPYTKHKCKKILPKVDDLNIPPIMGRVLKVLLQILLFSIHPKRCLGWGGHQRELF